MLYFHRLMMNFTIIIHKIIIIMDNIANTVKKMENFRVRLFPATFAIVIKRTIFVNIFTQHDNIIVQLEKLKFYKQ